MWFCLSDMGSGVFGLWVQGSLGSEGVQGSPGAECGGAWKDRRAREAEGAERGIGESLECEA